MCEREREREREEERERERSAAGFLAKAGLMQTTINYTFRYFIDLFEILNQKIVEQF